MEIYGPADSNRCGKWYHGMHNQCMDPTATTGYGSSRHRISARATEDVKGDTTRLPRAASTPGSISSRSRQDYEGKYVPLHLAALPGYLGYIPSKISENVIASTYQKGLETAKLSNEVCHSKTSTKPDTDYRMEKVSGGEKAWAIPGYTGYVPGKYCLNVFGTTVSHTNADAAWRKQEQFDERARWCKKMKEGGFPMPWGSGQTFPAYYDYPKAVHSSRPGMIPPPRAMSEEKKWTYPPPFYTAENR